MGHRMNIEYRLAIPDDAIAEPKRATSELPTVDTTSGGPGQFSCIAKAHLQHCPSVDSLTRQIRLQLTRHGFAVIDFTSLPADIDLAVDRTIMTALLSAVGTPVQIFNKWPLWKPIYTMTEVEPSRAGGTGFIPLHMDFVNAEHPPDYTCLLCLRDDPLGGGHSIVSRTDVATDALSS